MEYNQNQLIGLSDQELNNFRGLKFHITFNDNRIIKPNNNIVTEGEFFIVKTFRSVHLSKPAEWLSGFIISELNSDDENTVSFSSIKKMVSIDLAK